MSRDTKIKDVEIIRSGCDNIAVEQKLFVVVQTEGCIPKNREAIALYADEPCVEACQLLYDLNIQTYTSGGHVEGRENEEGVAFIGIVYDTLSEQNKKIVKEMIEDGVISGISDNIERQNIFTISLEVPIKSDSLVGDTSDKLVQLARHFEQQDVLYGRKTLEEIKTSLFVKIDDETYYDTLIRESVSKEDMQQSLPEYINYKNMYTADGKTYFISEDLLNKHLDYVNGLNSNKKI